MRVPSHASLLRIVAILMAAPTNRFGKPEFYSEEEMAAREKIRELAVHFRVGACDTVLHQAARVLQAALASDGANVNARRPSLPLPGPWIVEAERVDGDALISAINPANRHGAFAKVVVQMSEDDSESPHLVATAKLIAAAPDMHAILDELEGAFDEQTYPEKSRVDFDPPEDHEFSVTITAKQLRAISRALTKAAL